MHPNYLKSFARTGLATQHQPILSDRPGVFACAYRGTGESDVLMR